MTETKITVHLSTLDRPVFIESWKHEWGKYPSAGSDMHFSSNGDINGDWIVVRTEMIFGRVDLMEIWLEPKP